MDAIMIKERYKVIRALDVLEDYAFVEAVDILDREINTCVINLYEGEYLPRYLDSLDRLKGCEQYQGMMVAGETLAAVFDNCRGENIDDVFYKGAGHSWSTRLKYTEALLHKALELANAPPEISCAAFLSENVFVDNTEAKINLRYRIIPLAGMNGRELVYLVGDHVKKILLARFESPMEELEFLDRIDDGSCKTIVQLYAVWRRQKDLIENAYMELEKKSAFKRFWALLRKNVKYRNKKRRENKKR